MARTPPDNLGSIVSGTIALLVVFAMMMWLNNQPERPSEMEGSTEPGTPVASGPKPEIHPSLTEEQPAPRRPLVRPENTTAPEPLPVSDATTVEELLQQALYESGIEAALLSCPPPELDLPEGETFLDSTLTVDLVFGPEGLVRADYVGLSEGDASEEALACYADVFWELAWPAFPAEVHFTGTWSLRSKQRLEPEALDALRELFGKPELAADDVTFQVLGEDGQPTGAAMEIVE